MVDDGALRGHLRFDADRVRQFTRLEPRVISIHHGLKPDRLRVEAFLEASYAKAFGGHIARHYPTLMSIQDDQGTIHAAVGFRIAAGTPLFLEQYLDQPIETALGTSIGKPVARAAIAEIGNLASASPGASLFLFLALANHLHRQGCTHAAATATRGLRRSFARVGFQTERLAPAQASRLADGGVEWGSYYTQAPEVLAGSIAPALPALAQMLLAEPLDTPEVWPRLHPALSREFDL